jgi:hypothetical protein
MVAVVADEVLLLREDESSNAGRKGMPLGNLWCGMGWRKRRKPEAGKAFYGAGQAAVRSGLDRGE